MPFTQRAVDSSRYNFAMPIDAAHKMKRIESIGQKVPGQKDIFAPVLSGVPGQMTRCPCGFGAYGYSLIETCKDLAAMSRDRAQTAICQ